MNSLVRFLPAACALCLTVFTANALQSDTNTLLLLHFNSSLAGVAGEAPTQSSGLSFAPSVAGNGLRVTNGSQLHYAAAGNINATNGTLEFWIKPDWNGNDGQGRVGLRWGDGGGMLFFKDGGDYWRSIANRYGASGGKPEVGVSLNVSSEWHSNQWHHAAFTWSHQSLKLYVDGQLRNTAAINGLPGVNASTFQIGADSTTSYLDAVLDELRISDRERTAEEIQQSFLADVTVTGLAVSPVSTNLLVTWEHSPSLTATTAVGAIQVPAAAATWSSADTNIATVDVNGRITARAAGTTVITGALNGATATLTVNALPPLRAAQQDVIDPALATAAPGAIHDVPVMIINYIPTLDGVNVDPAILGGGTITSFQNKLTQFNKWVKFMLEEGSRFRGYSNPGAPPSLGYRIVHSVTAFERMPPGRSAGGSDNFPDYQQILNRFGAGTLVSNQNVKEIWVWGYHDAGIVPVESNMSSPLTGDISNSYRDNTDLPIYDRTFVLYNYNSMRSQAEAVHNHGHQLESILSYANQRQDGNTTLFWDKFCGRTNGAFLPGRCGNTHFPPNASGDYDYANPAGVLSDCMDWTPTKTGQHSLVNASTWGDLPYAWPGGNPTQKTESQYYIFWMQNMPGHQNSIAHGTNVMADWWQFTADWDSAISQNRGLHQPPPSGLVTPVSGQVFTSSAVLAPGTYHLPNGISVGASGVTLDLNGAVLIGSGFNGAGVTSVGFDNITIKNGTIRGYYYGVRVENGSQIQILDNNLSDNWVDPDSRTTSAPFLSINVGPNYGDRVNLGGGIFALNLSASAISRNTLTNQENGVDCFQVTTTQIDHNNASDNTGWGVHLSGSSSNLVFNNTADRCIRQPHGDSTGFLLVNASHHNQILSNSFQFSGDGFFIGNEHGCPSDFNLIQGNNGSHAGANAFEATFSQGNQFIGNIADASGYGFWLGYSHSSNVIRGNSIRGNNVCGIQIEHGQNNVIEDNDIIGNGGHGILLNTDGLPHFSVADGWVCLNLPNPAASRGYIIRNNRVHGNFGTALVMNQTTDSLIYNNLFGGPYAGTVTSDGANNVWFISPMPGVNVVGGPFLGGNWYFDYTGTDSNADGLGDTSVPYTNGGQMATPGDPHPLVASVDLGGLGNPGTLCDHVWIDLGRNTRSDGSTFNTENGTHFATDGQQLFLLEGANSTELSLFNPATKRYVSKAPIPEGVGDGGDFQFANGLFFATVGLGIDPISGAGSGSKLYAYNPTNNTWAARAPTTVNGHLVGNEALAYDPIGKRLYATIVTIKDEASGGDPSLMSKLAIYDPASNIWTGVTASAPDAWGGGTEAEYLDGKVYVWRGGFSGGLPNGSDSYLDAYDLATGTWSRTPSLSGHGIMPGFGTGGFDVWGVSLSADTNNHRLFVKGTEASRTLYVFDTVRQQWAAGPTAPYDGGWGSSIEYVSASQSLYQIDGRNSTATPQGTAALIQNTNTVRLAIAGVDANFVHLIARATVPGAVYAVMSKTNLNDAVWHHDMNITGAASPVTVTVPKSGRTALFFQLSLCGSPD